MHKPWYDSGADTKSVLLRQGVFFLWAGDYKPEKTIKIFFPILSEKEELAEELSATMANANRLWDYIQFLTF